MGDGGGDLTVLTHVWRARREIILRLLWTNLDCWNADKTRLYFERSKSPPINSRLKRSDGLSTDGPLFRIIPHPVSRLNPYPYLRGRKIYKTSPPTYISAHPFSNG